MKASTTLPDFANRRSFLKMASIAGAAALASKSGLPMRWMTPAMTNLSN